jgi:hypothetical protein
MSELLFLHAIPWDQLSRSDRTAIVWATAALLSAIPAALGAVLWVEGWRGVARFAAPRCRTCRATVRGSASLVPDRCPECGTELMVHGRPAVDYGARSLRPWSFAVRTLLGALAVACAMTVGWLGGGLVIWAEREALATGRSGSVYAALTDASGPRMVLDALRFAADVGGEDAGVLDEADRAILAYERGEIDPARGIALVLDRLDLGDARSAAIELIGALGEAGRADHARASRLLERIAGGPRLVLPRAVQSDAACYALLASGGPTLRASITSVRLDGGGQVAIERRSPFGAGGAELVYFALPPLEGSEPRALRKLRVAWRVEWPRALSSEEAVGRIGDIGSRFALTGEELVEALLVRSEAAVAPSELPFLPEGSSSDASESPFLAQALRPRWNVRAAGSVTEVWGTLQATLRPGVVLPGTFTLVVGDHRVPMQFAEGRERAELTVDALVPFSLATLPESSAVEYDPTPRASIADGNPDRAPSLPPALIGPEPTRAFRFVVPGWRIDATD